MASVIVNAQGLLYLHEIDTGMIQKLQQFFGQWALSENTALAPWIITVIVITVSLCAYLVLSWIFARIDRKRSDQLVNLAWKRYRYPFLVVILLFDFILLKELFTLEENASAAVSQFIKVAVIFCVTWLLIRSIKLTREVILKQYDIGEADNLKARRVYTQFRVLERIIIFVVILIAVAVALMTFEGIRRIGISLFASAGVAGIIIGFAAQKLLGSVLAGFQIALTQPIRIDDVVIVENEWGWIEEINLTYVVVRIWDKRRLIVPTTYFIEKPFQNWTRVSADILGTVYIYTDYHVPMGKLREAFMDILKGTELWDGKVGVMQVTNTTDRSVEVRALMSAENSPKAWDLRVLVREQLIAYLRENYPQSLPRTRVEMEGPAGQTAG
jgi:small-conductance mechanosensitive channel